MNIPIFQEIFVNDITKSNLESMLEAANFGLGPIFCDAAILDQDNLNNFIHLLIEISEEYQINLKVPYPIYIITDKIIHHSDICIISSIEQLPKYFFQKTRHLKSQEIPLFNKSKILRLKISALDYKNDLAALTELHVQKKQLLKLCQLHQFYETIEENCFTEEDYS